MPKTVFFGGTFNPPHISHRLMLESVARLDDVETVLVVPTNIPPHKDFKSFTASGEDRLEMCKLLCEGVDKAIVSDMELKRGGRSYSFDTLTELESKYSNISMLIGGDMITTFTGWYRYRDILKMCEILAVRRKGIDNHEFDKAVEGLVDDGGNVNVIEAELPEISSTSLREQLEAGCFEGELVPKNIEEFILSKGLYRGESK